jgi:DNA topoisomerase I
MLTERESGRMGADDLVYVCDTAPGIRRSRCGDGFRYFGADGAPVKSRVARARILSLGIPPAWDNVWICADPRGHIQATGRDAAGRKQYRYHDDWRERRDELKYDQLREFGHALPRLRRKLRQDIDTAPGGREFSIAALVMLLDGAHLRIGNRPAASAGSYGAATLRRQHVQLHPDGTIRLDFKGKGGKRVRRILRDRRLHRVLQAVGDLPGGQLFTWIDDAGEPQQISAQHVNAYLADAIGVAGVTAKTFRTWAGSVAAVECALLRRSSPVTIKALSEAAARRLHNTAAICRKAYIHPAALRLAMLAPEELTARLGARAPARPRGLNACERRLLRLLEDDCSPSR